MSTTHTHANGSSTATKPTRIAGESLDLAYAPAPETAKVRIHDRYNLFINNTWVAPRGAKSGSKSSDHYFPTLNPANESTLSHIAQAGDADVNAAVKAAVPPQINVLATAILVISLVLLAVGTLYRRKRIDI